MTDDGWVMREQDDGRPFQRPRLQDVAARAGVSKSLASKVLNRSAGLVVRPATRDRIFEAARTLNYQPHAAARALKRREAGLLGFIIPDLTNPAYARIVRGAVARASEAECGLLLLEDIGDRETADAAHRLLRTRRIDGVIVASAHAGHPLVDVLQEHPHVFVNRAVPGSDRNVTLDTAQASAAALEYLAGVGHTRVGHVAGPSGVTSSAERISGFLAHAEALGVEAAVEEGEFSEGGGARAADALLRRSPAPTALFTSSLSQAVGVLFAAWRRRCEVPAALSIVAYDDMPLAQYTIPPLTTVRMPLSELGALAVESLIAQLHGEPAADRQLGARAEVVVRRSTAPPPKGPPWS